MHGCGAGSGARRRAALSVASDGETGKAPVESRGADGNGDGYVICDVGAYETGACGLLGIEGLALLPLVRRLRRARSRRAPPAPGR